ncbi:MAG: hypothetical protein Greene041662_1035, partial [Candidatus Peregrinibacteria bacterium Greene0416_62]
MTLTQVNKIYPQDEEVEVMVTPYGCDVRCSDAISTTRIMKIRGMRKIVRVPQMRGGPQGELDYLPESRIDLQVISELGKEVGVDTALVEAVLSEAQREKGEAATGLSPTRLSAFKKSQRISRRMEKHADSLVRSGVIEKTNEIIFACPIFTLVKKIGKLRLIVDGRKTNQASLPPPPMMLKTLHEFLSHIFKFEVAATCDAKCYFYQIKIPRWLRRYFGIILAKKRGGFTKFRMCCLPMGWSWAPALAQRISNVIIKGLGEAYVDNFVIGASDIQKFSDCRAEFLRRIHAANLVCDDETLTASPCIEVLGLAIDLTKQTFKMASTTTLGAVPETLPIRALYHRLGTLIYFSFATRRPLCKKPHSLQALRNAALSIENMDDWDRVVTLTPTQREEMELWRAEYERNEEVHWEDEIVETSCEAWSDSSDNWGAYLIFKRELLLSSHRKPMNPEQHIFLKEMEMAVLALLDVP